MEFVRIEIVRFEDCDPAGIAFYPRFALMVNRTVEDWFAGPLNLPFGRLHGEMDAAIPAVALALDFCSPARLGEELTMSLRVDRVGRTSVSVAIEASGPLAMCFAAKLTLVYVTKADCRPRPWPEDIRERIVPYLSSSPL